MHEESFGHEEKERKGGEGHSQNNVIRAPTNERLQKKKEFCNLAAGNS